MESMIWVVAEEEEEATARAELEVVQVVLVLCLYDILWMIFALPI
jgi:hypothetical protein